MPFTVQQLIEGHQETVTVPSDEKAQKALELMIENDFSQLPVVDENNKPLGIVTSDSILRALNNFSISLTELHVSHAIVKVDFYNPDEDLFDLLDDLKKTYAVLIVNNEGNLDGIVTSYDTTEYFRRRAEDMMFVEDIESTLKDFIKTAFDVTNDPDQKTFTTVIAEITNTGIDKKFHNALNQYLNQCDKGLTPIDKDLSSKVFTNHFSSKEPVKAFDDLTLNEYIQLLLHNSKWSYFSDIFSLSSQAIRNLLDGVRKARNDLAHFHGEITANQRDQLHFCADWLERQRMKVFETFGAVEPEIVPSTVTKDGGTPFKAAGDPLNQNGNIVTEEEITPSVEVIGPDDSRYAILALWLQQRPLNLEKVSLLFEEIEELIHDKLPPSARKHRAWWSNHLEYSPQAKQWWDAGWRVLTVNMNQEKVVFTRIEERKKAYIDFFSTLLAQLDRENPLLMRQPYPSPTGQNWISITRLPKDGPRVASLGFSFARKKRFRVELYIDTGNEQNNKSIFDGLFAQKDTIETELGEPLSWERLDDGNTRASRIALYHVGSITNEDSLVGLKEWAVEAMLKFYRIIEPRLSEVSKMQLAQTIALRDVSIA
jgi:CBS domain-containing protein